jgi:diguanylate cyclase (GGDEF)-like protein
VRAAQEQIHRLAYYDALTGLPNRRLLRERFQQAIAWAERSGTKVAVLFLDLDRFKQVNDSLGHDAGDQLLQVVSERITASVRESDLVLRGPDDAGSTLARLGGDEFVLLLSPIARGEDAAKAAMRILQTLSDPVRLRTGDEVTTGVSIGIALYPGDGRDADTLMKRADLAMYHAKATGRSNAKFYDEALNTATEQRVGLETSLRRALSGHEFLVRYQPVIAADGAAVALDTQLFWRHPERGLLPEREFYDVARDAGLALNLGEWTIRVACDQMQAWQGSGRAPGALMVTATQALLDRGTLPDLLREALAECRFDPANLWVCVRNGTTTVPGSRAAESLRALSALGLQVVLDDFDAGRMSVPDLIAQPVGMVRLSGAWLGTVPKGGDAAVAARALIGLAHDLGMRVIASGVDDAATAACLRDLDCDFQLGAAHAAPLDAEDVQGASA